MSYIYLFWFLLWLFLLWFRIYKQTRKKKIPNSRSPHVFSLQLYFSLRFSESGLSLFQYWNKCHIKILTAGSRNHLEGVQIHCYHGACHGTLVEILCLLGLKTAHQQSLKIAVRKEHWNITCHAILFPIRKQKMRILFSHLMAPGNFWHLKFHLMIQDQPVLVSVSKVTGQKRTMQIWESSSSPLLMEAQHLK